MYEHVYNDETMPSKNISITDDIYNGLVKLKRDDESFSDIIGRLMAERKKDPLKFFGILEDVPDEIFDDFEKGMDDLKKSATTKANEKIEQEW